MYQYTLAVFRDMYYHELEINESINSRLSVPLAALSIVVTFIIYCISQFKSLPASFFTCWSYCGFYIVIWLILGLVMIALALLVLISNGYLYSQMPTAMEIYCYAEKVEKNHDDSLACEREDEIAEEFNTYISNLYRDTRDENFKNNMKKMKYIRVANLCTISAVVLCLVIAIYYLLN